MFRTLFKSRVVAVSAGALLVVGLGSTAAIGHGMIGSDDIRNFAVQKRHIGGQSIGAFELRGGVVRSNHLHDNTVRWRDLQTGVQDQLNDQELRNDVTQLQQDVQRLESGSGAAATQVQDLERQPLETPPGTTVASFPAEGGQSYVLTAKATLQNLEQDSPEVDLDHGSCSLKDGDTVLDQTAVALGQDTSTGETAFAPVTLTTVVSNTSDATRDIELVCFGGGEPDTETDDRTIADITITGVEVETEDEDQ